MVRTAPAILAALLAVGVACAPRSDSRDEAQGGTSETSMAGATDPGREIDPPAEEDSLAPELLVHESRLLLSWLEPVGDGAEGHRLRFSALGDDGWSAPATIVEDRTFFANWADRPGLASRGDGGLIAYWLEKTAPHTYSYAIQLAGSDDDGATWRLLGRLNDDATDSEHGFVSWVIEGAGARAFWLDGRATIDGRPMTLRTALVDREIGASELLDEAVCDCCSTDAVALSDEPVVVFRDRSAEEIRDISTVRLTAGVWSESVAVHKDGWRIEGCPVNGPEMAAIGPDLAVAWFSAPEDRPRVQLAFADGTGLFQSPLLLDGDSPLGRVGLVEDGAGGVVASWLGKAGNGAEIRLVRVPREGPVGPVLGLAQASAARSSGVPRLVGIGELLYVAWVDAGPDRSARLRVREIPLAAVPGP